MDSFSSKALKRSRSRNSSANRRQRQQSYYEGCDMKLLPRINQYLQSYKESKYVDVEDIVDHLLKTYSEYRRKKKNAFTCAVAKAYSTISNEDSVLDYRGNGSVVSNSEMGDDVKMDLGSDFSDDNENYVVVEDTNAANNSLRALYSQNNNQSNGKQQDKSLTKVVSDVKVLQASNADTHRSMTTNTTGSKLSDNNCRSAENETTENVMTKNSTTKEQKTNPGKKKSLKTSKYSKEVVLQRSSNTFSDIGGSEDCIKEVCKLLVHLKHPEVYSKLGVCPPRGILLHGPPGCGKTLMAHAIAGELDLPFIKIAATEIVSGVSGESEEKIRDLFEQAVLAAPCVLFIDEIDAITPKRETVQREMERRIVAQLLTCLDDLNAKDIVTQVLVIGATNRPDALDPALRRAGRFDREIKMGIPDEAARMRTLKVLCRNLRLSPDVELNRIAANTPGYVGADLVSLTREAAMCAVNRVFHSLQTIDATVDTANQELQNSTAFSIEIASVLSWLHKPPLSDEQLESLYIENSDFEYGLTIVQPSAMREGFATVPDVTWEDVGALQTVREDLHMSIVAPIRYATNFKMHGLTTPVGILLCGPPGCGKTLLAKAIANESGLNFISVKGPELLNMYVGESERAVRQCFQRAHNSSPCVIFFDEVDALCSKRIGSSEGGASVRVANQLLTEMDGLDRRRNVFILAATNRPDIIDPAFLRPGRFEKVLFVGLPSAEERIDILNTISKNATMPSLQPDVTMRDIGLDPRCNGFTGADLAALIRQSSMTAIKEMMDMGNLSMSSDNSIAKRHIEAAFLTVRRSVSPKDLQRYERMKQLFCNPSFSRFDHTDDVAETTEKR